MFSKKEWLIFGILFVILTAQTIRLTGKESAAEAQACVSVWQPGAWCGMNFDNASTPEIFCTVYDSGTNSMVSILPGGNIPYCPAGFHLVGGQVGTGRGFLTCIKD